MSFSEEFKKMRSIGAPKVTPEIDKEAQEAAAAKDASAPPQEDPDAALIGESLKHGDGMGEVEDAPAAIVIPPPKEEVKKVKVKIGGKEFDTIEEAQDYADQTLAEAEKKEAYIKGKEDALKPQEPTKKEIKRAQLIADKMFEDPTAAVEEILAFAKELAAQDATDREATKTAAQIKAEAQTKAVDDFYKANADLVEWQDEVNMVVDRNTAYLKTVAPDKLASEAARLAREYVASVKEKALPRTTLNSKPAITSAGGTKSASTTTKPATENKVSFAQQVRSTNKRTVMQDEA